MSAPTRGDEPSRPHPHGGASAEVVPRFAVPDDLRADALSATRLADRLSATGRGALAECVEMALSEALALARLAPVGGAPAPDALADFRVAIAALEVEVEAPAGPHALGELADQAWRMDQLVERLRRARSALLADPPPTPGG